MITFSVKLIFVLNSAKCVKDAWNEGEYQTYNKSNRFNIENYASENRNFKCLVHSKYYFPGLKESTVRGFKKEA